MSQFRHKNTPESPPRTDRNITHFRIEQTIEGDRGFITFTMSPLVFGALFERRARESAENQNEFYDERLRELCSRYNNERTGELLAKLEGEHPGSTTRTVETPEGLTFDSRELGHELVKRFAPQPHPDEETLLDPTYSDVEVELRVFDAPAGHTAGDSEESSHLVHHTVLQPPNLA